MFFRHLLLASRWRNNGWEGDSLPYAEEAISSLGEGASDFGLSSTLDYTWTEDGTMFCGAHRAMGQSFRDIRNYSKELHEKLAVIDTTIARDGEDAVSSAHTD